MQRLTLMMAVVFVTLLGAPTPSMVSHSQAATTANVSATDPSGIDALEYERAAVTLDGRVLFQVRGLPAYPANERAPPGVIQLHDPDQVRKGARQPLRSV